MNKTQPMNDLQPTDSDILSTESVDIHADLVGDDYADAMMRELFTLEHCWLFLWVLRYDAHSQE